VGCLEARSVRSGSDAVRRLVEAVPERKRTDFDWLKQNVVPRISCHDYFHSTLKNYIETLACVPQGPVSQSAARGGRFCDVAVINHLVQDATHAARRSIDAFVLDASDKHR
jgi:hypothetical protein